MSQVDEFDASFQSFLTPKIVTFVTLHPHQDSIRSFARWRSRFRQIASCLHCPSPLNTIAPSAPLRQSMPPSKIYDVAKLGILPFQPYTGRMQPNRSAIDRIGCKKCPSARTAWQIEESSFLPCDMGLFRYKLSSAIENCQERYSPALVRCYGP